MNDVETVKDATICFKKLRIRISLFPATFADASTINPISRARETTVNKKYQNMINIMLRTHSNAIPLSLGQFFEVFLQVKKTKVNVCSRLRVALTACSRRLLFGAMKTKKEKFL